MRWLLALLLIVPMLAGAAVGDPTEMLPDPRQEERARALGRELRCMVCQNQSIEDSDAGLARDLRRIVREQVAAGRSDGEIIGFLHARYGDFVLLRPPLRAGTVLLWAMPALALGLGVALILGARRQRRRLAPAAPLTAEEQARLAALAGKDRA